MALLLLTQLLKEAKNVRSSQFLELLQGTINQLESEKGKIDNFIVEDGLVKLPPSGEALIVGDLHGDLDVLKKILEKSKILNKLEKSENAYIIFLGDYGDRGAYSVEVYYIILSLKLLFPKRVFLLRGNHEGPKDLAFYPHELPLQLQRRFLDDWQVVNETMFNLFEQLYVGIHVENQYLLIHGGVSPKITCLRDIADAASNRDVLLDLLWSDPDDEVEQTSYSMRGIGVLFGEKVTDKVLKAINAKIIIRGHEATQQGFKLNHNGKIVTLFSRKGEPYFNKYAAYMVLPLEKQFNNGCELEPFIHKL